MYLYSTSFQKFDTSFENIYIIGRQKTTKEIRVKKKIEIKKKGKTKRLYRKSIQ